MDTREKILPLQHAGTVLANGNWRIVVGLFDPLTAVQAKRLAANREDAKLFVLVLEAEDALLSAEARAALVAALGSVDAVAIAAPENWAAAIPANPSIGIVEDSEGEKRRSAEFVEFVLQRQRCGA